MLALGGDERLHMVHEPPSLLGTTPSLEQRVLHRGVVGYGPAMQPALHSLRDCVRVGVSRESRQAMWGSVGLCTIAILDIVDKLTDYFLSG